MTGAATDDAPPVEPRVERVEKDDGRYILYFSWPEAASAPSGERRADQEEAIDE